MSDNLLTTDDVWDDTELIKMYDEAMKTTSETSWKDSKAKSPDKKPPKTDWKVGDLCMALYAEDELCYDAVIIAVNIPAGKVTVRFTDYDETAELDFKDVYGTDEVQFLDEAEEKEAETSQSFRDRGRNPSLSLLRESLPDHSSHIPVPDILPPPPELFEKVDGSDEVSSNMLLSWYLSGYHTGYYKALQDMKKRAR